MEVASFRNQMGGIFLKIAFKIFYFIYQTIGHGSYAANTYLFKLYFHSFEEWKKMGQLRIRRISTNTVKQ